jgi:hypothetical protein
MNSECRWIPYRTPEDWKEIGVNMADRLLEHVRQFETSGQIQVLEACRKRLRQRDPHFTAVFFGHPQR